MTSSRKWPSRAERNRAVCVEREKRRNKKDRPILRSKVQSTKEGELAIENDEAEE